MALSQRERYVAIGVVAVAALYALDQFLIEPMWANRDRIVAEREKTDGLLKSSAALFDRQKRLEKTWAEMNQNGLKYDPSEADAQMIHAMEDWQRHAGVTPGGVKSDRPITEGKFQQIALHATGTGPMRSIAMLLWDIENSPIPVRINEVQLASRKEASDDLQMQLNVSTLCVIPEVEKPGAREAGGQP